MIHDEIKRVDEFRTDVYEKKHGELVAQVNKLEKRIEASELLNKGIEMSHKHLYTVLGASVGILSVIIALLDHFVSK